MGETLITGLLVGGGVSAMGVAFAGLRLLWQIKERMPDWTEAAKTMPQVVASVGEVDRKVDLVLVEVTPGGADPHSLANRVDRNSAELHAHLAGHGAG